MRSFIAALFMLRASRGARVYSGGAESISAVYSVEKSSKIVESGNYVGDCDNFIM
jgi:hypothetical protein